MPAARTSTYFVNYWRGGVITPPFPLTSIAFEPSWPRRIFSKAKRMLLPVTAIYASLIALLFLFLSARVIMYRRENRHDLGDAGDRKLLKRIRAQGNCAEYAPFGLLLLVIAELQGASAPILHVLGLMLVLGRIAHALALSLRRQDFRLRVLGMMLTLIMIGISALGVLIQALTA